MNLHELVSQVVVDSRGSLDHFLPELVLCATIVVMLLVRMSPLRRFVGSLPVVLAGTITALALTGPWLDVSRQEMFTGMLVYDGFTVFLRTVLLLFVILFVLFTRLSGLPDREDSTDIYTLVLGATLGMCIMASANHLLTIFLGVEMASVPSYALAAMLKGRRQSSEAALKYSVYGAGAAGVMLYGISLIAGIVNTAHLPTIAWQLAEKLPEMGGQELMVLSLGGLMIGVGLSFKLSAVPFHFWCPDVFEGATAEVNAFLSVASKAAALALLVRVAVGFGALPPASAADQPSAATAQASLGSREASSALFSVASDEPMAKAHEASDAAATATTSGSLTRQAAIRNLAPVRDFIGKLVAFIAVLTCTFGNLAAYGQTNIKRLFAYSTIAHAGYMMMAVPPMVAMAGHDAASANRAAAGLAVYVFVYLFMNLGAFVIIAFWRNALRSENISDYAGLIRRCPVTVVCFTAILFSLIGLPPLAGFIGKFAVFAQLAQGYNVTSAHGQPAFYLFVTLIIASLNTAISLFYYLRVIKVMTIDAEPKDRRPFELSNPWLQGVFVCVVTFPLLALIFGWNWLSEWSVSAASQLVGV